MFCITFVPYKFNELIFCRISDEKYVSDKWVHIFDLHVIYIYAYSVSRVIELNWMKPSRSRHVPIKRMCTFDFSLYLLKRCRGEMRESATSIREINIKYEIYTYFIEAHPHEWAHAKLRQMILLYKISKCVQLFHWLGTTLITKLKSGLNHTCMENIPWHRCNLELIIIKRFYLYSFLLRL